LLTAQYSMSTDTTITIEILVLRLRDPKEFLEVGLTPKSETRRFATLGRERNCKWPRSGSIGIPKRSG